MTHIRFKISSKCNHCGVEVNGFWLWEHEIRDKYICGNCNFKEAVLTNMIDRIEVDPLKPFEAL